MIDTNNNFSKNSPFTVIAPPSKETINNSLINLYSNYNDITQTCNAAFYLEIYYRLNINSVAKDSVEYHSLIYKLALSKFNNGDYLNTQTLILSQDLHKVGLEFQILLGNCYLKIGNFPAAKEILSLEINSLCFDQESNKNKYLSYKKLLLAKLFYELLEINTFVRFLKESLIHDPTNYEAFNLLQDSYAEAKDKLYKFFDSLNYPNELLFIKNYYKSFVSDEIHLTEEGQFIDVETSIINSNNNNNDLEINKDNKTIQVKEVKPHYQYTKTVKNVIEVLYENKFENLTILEAFKYYEINKDFVTARNKLEEIYKTSPYNLNLIITLCNCYYNLNVSSKIWKLLDSTNSSIPQWVKCYCLGCYYLLKEKPVQAKESFIECINVKEVWIHLGKLEQMISDNLDKSANIYSTAIKRFPAFYDLYLNYAKVLIAQDELKQAHQYLHTAFSLCQFDPHLYNELGTILFKTNQLDQALATFNKGVELVKDFHSEIYLNLIINKGHALRKLGKLGEALDCYNTAIQIHDKDSNLACSIGFIYYSLGKLDLALDYYHKANYLDPENYMIKEMLRKCLEEFVPITEIGINV